MIYSEGLSATTRVLIVSSSESLARIEPESCRFEDTWPGLLRNHCYTYQMSVGGITIDMLYSQLKTYHVAFNPDIVIIQAGINDCVPRTLKKRELKLLQSFSIGRWLLKTVIKRYSRQIRNHRDITYTDIDTYTRYFQSIGHLFPKAFIMPISILYPDHTHAKIVNHLPEKVTLYNNRLRELYPNGYVSIDEIPREGVMSDHIHFNSVGHQFIYEKVMKVLGSRFDTQAK